MLLVHAKTNHYLPTTPFMQSNFFKLVMAPFHIILGLPQPPSTLHSPTDYFRQKKIKGSAVRNRLHQKVRKELELGRVYKKICGGTIQF